jgi:hypothetical protein
LGISHLAAILSETAQESRLLHRPVGLRLVKVRVCPHVGAHANHGLQ